MSEIFKYSFADSYTCSYYISTATKERVALKYLTTLNDKQQLLMFNIDIPHPFLYHLVHPSSALSEKRYYYVS